MAQGLATGFLNDFAIRISFPWKSCAAPDAMTPERAASPHKIETCGDDLGFGAHSPGFG